MQGPVFEGTFQFGLYTDLAAAADGAAVIVCMLPAEGHEELLHGLSKTSFAKSGGILVMVAGVFATPLINVLLPGVIAVESPTLPYVARMAGDAAVNIYDAKSRYIVGPAKPLSAGQAALLKDVFPSVRLDWQPDALLANLKGVNFVIHVVTALIAFEDIVASRGRYYFYKEIMSRDDVHPDIHAISNEIVTLQQAFGYPESQIESTLDVLNRNYGTAFETIKDFALNTIPHNAEPMCPTSLPNHRYLTQDAKAGNVFLLELAKLLAVPVPNIACMVDIASHRLKEDIRKTGRTFANAGLGDAAIEQVRKTFGMIC